MKAWRGAGEDGEPLPRLHDRTVGQADSDGESPSRVVAAGCVSDRGRILGHEFQDDIGRDHHVGPSRGVLRAVALEVDVVREKLSPRITFRPRCTRDAGSPSGTRYPARPCRVPAQQTLVGPTPLTSLIVDHPGCAHRRTCHDAATRIDPPRPRRRNRGNRHAASQRR